MGGEESFYFLAYGFVSATSFRKKASALLGWPLQSRVEESIQVLPALGCHGDRRAANSLFSETSQRFKARPKRQPPQATKWLKIIPTGSGAIFPSDQPI